MAAEEEMQNDVHDNDNLHWRVVEAALMGATAIAFDGCHKIYVSMYSDAPALDRLYGYPHTEPVARGPEGRQVALKQIQSWYDESCSLKYVTAIDGRSSLDRPYWFRLIGQGETPRNEEETNS